MFFFLLSCVSYMVSCFMSTHADLIGDNGVQRDKLRMGDGWKCAHVSFGAFSLKMVFFFGALCHNTANGLHCSQFVVCMLWCWLSFFVVLRHLVSLHVHFWCLVIDWISNDAKNNELSQKMCFEVRRNGIFSSVKSDSVAAQVKLDVLFFGLIYQIRLKLFQLDEKKCSLSISPRRNWRLIRSDQLKATNVWREFRRTKFFY